MWPFPKKRRVYTEHNGLVLSVTEGAARTRITIVTDSSDVVSVTTMVGRAKVRAGDIVRAGAVIGWWV